MDGFPEIRWHQTADYGYVPNVRMKKVFMAVAMDLGDPDSPWGSVHPRDKQDVGYRLALAGRAVGYDDESLYYTGPIARIAKAGTAGEIMIMFDRVATSGLEVRSKIGFEVYCYKSGQPIWVLTDVKSKTGNSVVIGNPCSEGLRTSHVRYSWREDPCVFKKCAVYSGDLPSPPFILPVTAA